MSLIKGTFQNYPSSIDSDDNTIQGMFQVACHLGLTSFGVALPFDIKQDSLPDHIWENILDNRLIAGSKVPKSPTTVLRSAIEVTYYEDEWERVSNLLKPRPFDCIIGSVNRVEVPWKGGTFFPVDGDVSVWRSLPNGDWLEGSDEIWEAFYPTAIKMVKSGLVHAMDRFDLPKKAGYVPAYQIESEVHDAQAMLLYAMAEHNVALNLNTSGLFDPCHETYPSLSILEQAYHLSLPIMISSGARDARNICRGFETAVKLATMAGYELYIVDWEDGVPNFDELPQ